MLLFLRLRSSYFTAALFFFLFDSTAQGQCPVPTHPTVVVTHPTCNVRTGAITVNNPAPGIGVIFSINGAGNNTTGIFSDLVSGIYIVTVNYGSGCISLPLNVTINAPPPIPPQPTATPVQPTCTLATGTITITTPATAPGISYSINGTDYGNTNGIFPGLNPNTYTITVKNSYGCVSPALSVTINAPPPVPEQPTATPTHPTCAVATGTIKFNSPAPAAGITYSIDGKDYSNTNGIFPGLAPKTYNVTVKNSYGCISAEKNITVNASPPVPIIMGTAVDIPCGKNTGIINVNVTSGSSPFTYSLNGATPVSNNIFSGLAAGTYKVTVKDAGGCSADVNVTIKQIGSNLAANATAAEIQCGQRTGVITVNVTGGTAPFTYSLNGGTPLANNSFINLAAGNYKVTVKDATGCSVDAGVTIKAIGCSPISESKVFVPTAFTPNNNRINDYLQPYLLNIQELVYFKVFNRWGQLVFSTNQIGKGWNGNIKGISQPGETYTWILACIDIDGKVIKRSGHSLMIK